MGRAWCAWLCVAAALGRAGGLRRVAKGRGRVVPHPSATRLQDLGAGDLNCTDCEAVQMRDWDVKIMVYPGGDTVSKEVRATGTWEPEAVTRACDEYVRHGAKGNMLDIGGNIGTFTLPLAACLRNHSKGKGIVVAVEALKSNSALLRASIKANNADNIHLYEYAVSNNEAPDTIRFHEEPNNKGHSRITGGEGDPNDHIVPVTTIDAIAEAEGGALERVFFMKMDIEGHEPEALKGAGTFLQHGPCLVFAELGHWNSKTKPLLEHSGYVMTSSGKGTGGVEGWFEHRNMTECVARL